MDISFIKNEMCKLLDECGIDKSRLCEENNSFIYYMNGNDGTEFDFMMNDRSCEFMCFYKSSNFGAIRMMAERETNALHYYVYDEVNSQKIIKQGDVALPSYLHTWELCKCLYNNFDCENIFDRSITDWELDDNKHGKAVDFAWDSDEDDDI